MKNTYKVMMILAAGLMFGGCDKTEDGFLPGPVSDLKLEVAQTGEVEFTADGGSLDIEVQSSVTWTARLVQTGNVFSLVNTSGKGNDKLTVTATPNYDSEAREAQVVITGNYSDLSKTVQIKQPRFVFEMTTPATTSFKSDGGSFELVVTSSFDWYFEKIGGGEFDWLEFEPLSGDGDMESKIVRVTVKPNVSETARNVTFRLRPQDQTIYNSLNDRSKLPANITISQEAGERPAYVSGTSTHISGYNWNISVDYQSGVDVSEVGVIVKRDYHEVRRVAANKSGGSYPNNGPVSVNFTWEAGEQDCVVVPYATSTIGTTEGSSLNIKYGVIITNVEFTQKDREIWNLKVEGYNDISISSTTATIYNSEGEVVKTFDAGTWLPFEQDISDLKLSPKTTYKIQVEIKTELMNLKSEMVEFTTGAVKPGADDNTPPEV